VLLVGTTNAPDIIDPAMISRFHLVQFPAWSDLSDKERESFAQSHGLQGGGRSLSYANAVQKAMRARRAAIIAKVKEKEMSK
jgi:hypothetical protein